MTDLYLFTYHALFYPDDGPKPRQRAAVGRFFDGLNNGQITGQAAVLWPCYEVGQRYTLKRAGVEDRRLSHLPHEAQAEENAARLAESLGLASNRVYLSFNWVNYTDKRAMLGPGLVPEERKTDPRWSSYWRFPEPGMIAEALKDAGIGPGGALFVYEHSNEKAAADRLFLPTCFSAQFFLSFPKHDRYVEQRRVTRRPLDEFVNEDDR